jgi:hypothetical protein
MEQGRAGDGFDFVADIPIEEVRTAAATVVLQGHGTDRQDYRLELHFDIPVDAKTRKVLAELLSQADVRVSRRAGIAAPGGPPGRGQ